MQVNPAILMKHQMLPMAPWVRTAAKLTGRYRVTNNKVKSRLSLRMAAKEPLIIVSMQKMDNHIGASISSTTDISANGRIFKSGLLKGSQACGTLCCHLAKIESFSILIRITYILFLTELQKGQTFLKVFALTEKRVS